MGAGAMNPQGHLHHLNGFKLELAVVIAAGMGFTLFGYDQGVMSGIITEPLFVETFPKMSTDYKTAAIQALVVAIYELGALLGAIAIYFLGDKLGRRRAVFVGSIWMIIGAIIQTASFSLGQLIAGRIITGIGNGMNTSSIPVWQSEMAAPQRRGFLVLFEGALIAGGIAIAYSVNLGFWFLQPQFNNPSTSVQWRFPFAFQIVFAIFMMIGVWLLPESPRWLMKKGHHDDARRVLARLRADGNVDDPLVERELKEMKSAIQATEAGGPLTAKELFSNGKEQNLTRLLLAVGAQAMQQIGGINLVTYYATSVFEDSIGTSPTVSRILTVANGWEYFASAVIALFVVDRLGRRKLMIVGAIVMAISTMFLAGFLSTGQKNFAIGVFTFVFNSGFAFGWLGVTWLYPAEITPLRIRAEANALATCSNWLGNYLIVQIAPIGLNSIEWKFYFVFMCTNLAHIPIVYFFYPEPKGWSLEQMDALFAQSYEERRNCVFVEKDARWVQKKSPEEIARRLATKGGEKGAGAVEEQQIENVDQGNKREMMS